MLCCAIDSAGELGSGGSLQERTEAKDKQISNCPVHTAKTRLPHYIIPVYVPSPIFSPFTCRVRKRPETSDPPCKPKKDVIPSPPGRKKKNSRQFEIALQIDGWHLILALSGGRERRKEDSPCQIGSGNFRLLEDVTGGRCTTIEMRGGPYW